MNLMLMIRYLNQYEIEKALIENYLIKKYDTVKWKWYNTTNMCLDNEVLEEYLDLLEEQDTKVQLVLPHNHRQKPAE